MVQYTSVKQVVQSMLTCVNIKGLCTGVLLKFALAEHQLEIYHQRFFESASFVAKSFSYLSRKICETINIIKYPLSINREASYPLASNWNTLVKSTIPIDSPFPGFRTRHLGYSPFCFRVQVL